MSERPRSVGMAWYDRETYLEVRRMMVDPERLAESYDQWLASAEQIEGEVARSGVAVLRVPIEAQAFAAWCAEHERPCDGAARSAFAQAVAAEG